MKAGSAGDWRRGDGSEAQRSEGKPKTALPPARRQRSACGAKNGGRYSISISISI